MNTLLALLLVATPDLTVLWPRIIPSAQAEQTSELAAKVQVQVTALARRTMPGRALDVRPKGERSCPETGCPGGSLGVLLIRKGEGCAAVALVGVPGRSKLRLAAWAGQLELKKYEVEFRDPPESQVRVVDFVPCAALVAAMEAPNADVERAVHDMLGSP